MTTPELRVWQPGRIQQVSVDENARVLVVDDDELIRDTLATALTERPPPGRTVLSCCNLARGGRVE